MQLNNGVGRVESSFCHMLNVKRLFDVEGSCTSWQWGLYIMAVGTPYSSVSHY